MAKSGNEKDGLPTRKPERRYILTFPTRQNNRRIITRRSYTETPTKRVLPLSSYRQSVINRSSQVFELAKRARLAHDTSFLRHKILCQSQNINLTDYLVNKHFKRIISSLGSFLITKYAILAAKFSRRAKDYLLPTTRYLRYGVAIAALLLLSLVPWLSSLLPNSSYDLSSAAQLLVNKPNQYLNNTVSFDSYSSSYVINPKGLHPALSPNPSTLVGQPGSGLYSASLPTNLDKGISVTDNSNHVGFSLTPQFNTSQGKHIGGHFIYPLGNGAIQAVYTAKSTQLAEDLVINNPVGNALSFPYSLKLPATFKAFNLAGGSIAIEQGGKILFQLANPTIKQSNGQTGGTQSKAKASLILKNNQLTLVATNLSKLSYPITIDPSITINSATSMLLGNDEGGNNISTNQFSTGAQTGGGIGSTGWNSTTSLLATTSYATSVAYNGYVYEIGGYNGSAYVATVDYAPINSNGTLGSWTATTSLLATTGYATSVAYNGYVYEIGGYNGSAYVATVDYAPINSNGTLGAWAATTSLPAATSSATSVAYNGYVYEIGGQVSGSVTTTVDVAPINSNGTLGSWTATTSLPAATDGATSVVYNGYVYEIGGFTTAVTSSVYYAPINSNGTLGAWAATTSLPAATENATSVAYNGYVYEIGGFTTASTETVDYSQINANGSLGAWIETTSLLATTEHASSIVYDGYIYEIGGSATVDFAQIAPAGWVSSPNSSTANAWAATTSLPTAVDMSTSVAYNGYVYQIGGGGGISVNYALISSNGTLGTWTATTSLPAGVQSATSVVYNGYVYEMGGYNGSVDVATVDYAPINSNGTLGAWTATTSLPAVTEQATSVAYNGYVYEIGGGVSGGSNYSAVDYAPINSNGTLGSWTATTSLPAATFAATSVEYNGYVYEIGGDEGATGSGTVTAAVDYAPINSNGTLGAWTATTSLPAAIHSATSVVYNGYVYEIGGDNSSGADVATVDYALINSNGTLGAWTATTSLGVGTVASTSVVYNGYVYEIGGYTTKVVAIVSYAYINNGGPGTIGSYTAATSLPSATDSNISVVYNGYVYEIGGYTTSVVATVDYAPINSNGTLGSWTATTSLPIATEYATSVAYNGYVYEIGGQTNTSNAVVATVDYAPINSNGTLGAWTATTSLPAATDIATSVEYNGYVYEIGGYTSAVTSSVYYAPINSNGTLGSWTATTSLPIATVYATSVVYNGFVYEIGGSAGGATSAVVDYAPINSNGTLGSWTATTSLPIATEYATSVAYNGYVYEIGGYNGSAYVATVDYAPINSNGTLGVWTATTSLPAATNSATSVVYNGYVYEIGGYTTATIATVDYAPLYSIPRVGSYSMLVNVGGGVNVTPISVIAYGSNTGNPGNGGSSGLGGISITYSGASTTCSTFSPTGTVNLIPNELGSAFNLTLSSNGCGSTTNLGEYIWIHFHLDDSQTATFPDINGNHTTITGFQIFYHPASSNRLRGGATFNGGSLQSLDAPPSTVQ